MTMMSMIRLTLLWLFLGFATAKTNHTGSKVLIHIPEKLHSPSPAGYLHEMASFGVWWSSGPRSLTEYVYYLDEALCSPLTNLTEGYPVVKDSHRETPFIVMVNDGACNLVTKSRFAQMMGASAVLIADDKCKCNHKNCTDKYPDAPCDDSDYRLVDDGSGQDVSIPSFLIYKDLAEQLKHTLKNQSQPVLMELQWNLYHSKKPFFHLWTTSYDPLVTLESYADIKVLVDTFQDSIEFSPRYSLIDGKRFNCGPGGDNQLCNKLCTNHGRYCGVSGDVSGEDQVKETLRRLCVWKEEPARYWNYVLHFKEHCSTAEHFTDPKCIADALRSAGLKNEKTVDDCMTGSGAFGEDSTNTILEDQLARQKRSGVQGLPTITVNRHNIGMSVTRLFDTICTSLWLSSIDTVPKICETCASCPNKVGCLEHGKCVDFSNQERHRTPPGTGGSGSPKKNSHVFAKIFWTFAVLCMVAGAWYYYDLNREQFPWNNRNRSALLNDYMHLGGES